MVLRKNLACEETAYSGERCYEHLMSVSEFSESVCVSCRLYNF